MSYMGEYIKKGISGLACEQELLRLISQYNKLREAYLLVYAATTEKPIPLVSLQQTDYYVIRDLLSGHTHHPQLDIYLETRGGSGETAEEIVRFLRDNFKSVSFVVSGEAKSAGTIMVLSGNEILMTETGSLGPIDAQLKVGRSIVSAYNYIEWIDQKKKEAEQTQTLNPVDGRIIAQISPGELQGVHHSLEFAKELVVPWLIKYKFSQWTVTETRKKPVTAEMKEERARQIAKELTDHSRWRSHGKSIKIKDLESEEINLKITHVDDDSQLADIVYRIQTICRLLFDSTSVFKIFATQDERIMRGAIPAKGVMRLPSQIKSPAQQLPDVVEIRPKCSKCGKSYQLYAKFVPVPEIDEECRKKGLTAFPRDAKIICDCGVEIDLLGLKNQIELQIGRKIIYAEEAKRDENKKSNKKKPRPGIVDIPKKDQSGRVHANQPGRHDN